MNPTYEQASPAASKVIINLMQEIERLKQENKELRVLSSTLYSITRSYVGEDTLILDYSLDITAIEKLLEEKDTNVNNT
jgi:hypothetical protein